MTRKPAIVALDGPALARRAILEELDDALRQGNLDLVEHVVRCFLQRLVLDGTIANGGRLVALAMDAVRQR